MARANPRKHPNFAFIGAGEASYFEWAEMFVLFEEAPSRAARAAIAKRVPPPLRDTIEWRGRLLWVASEQGVSRLVKSAYAKVPEAPSKLTTQTKHATAPASATARFNADIVDWLGFAHAKSPILLAFRREDAEAGGTRLDDWHRSSLKGLPDLAAKLTEDEAEFGKRLVGVAEHYAVKLPPKTKTRLLEADEGEEDDEAPDWDKLAANAAAALGRPAPGYTKKRSVDDVVVALSKILPKTAKRLARMGKKEGLALRPGASEKAIAGAEKMLGAKLTKAHRALLAAFDGGEAGTIVFLGTADGGSKGDAEIAAFSRIWSGEEQAFTIVARTGRELVVTLARDGKGKGGADILDGKPGWGGGSITRSCKDLDTALDVALAAGRVPSNRAGG